MSQYHIQEENDTLEIKKILDLLGNINYPVNDASLLSRIKFQQEQQLLEIQQKLSAQLDVANKKDYITNPISALDALDKLYRFNNKCKVDSQNEELQLETRKKRKLEAQVEAQVEAQMARVRVEAEEWPKHLSFLKNEQHKEELKQELQSGKKESQLMAKGWESAYGLGQTFLDRQEGAELTSTATIGILEGKIIKHSKKLAFEVAKLAKFKDLGTKNEIKVIKNEKDDNRRKRFKFKQQQKEKSKKALAEFNNATFSSSSRFCKALGSSDDEMIGAPSTRVPASASTSSAPAPASTRVPASSSSARAQSRVPAPAPSPQKHRRVKHVKFSDNEATEEKCATDGNDTVEELSQSLANSSVNVSDNE